MAYKKKLIEVALPLEAINTQSAREKSIRHGHPSTLHLWWARRPLAAARAVIWASLVDDPSSLPEQFPTEEEQNSERERLFKILTELVKWENSNNQTILDAAKAEIMKSTNNNPPALLDPFAGGGAIPLEAQRLGLEAHASDLNPIAVMINKAMIEIPPKFAGQPPMNPDTKINSINTVWTGAQGLAEDVRYYGEWMKQEAFKRIGHLYPKVKDERGQEHTVIAWIWARTVASPNPLAHGAHVPLISSNMLSTKKDKKAWVDIVLDTESKNGWKFEVKTGDLSSADEATKKHGTKAGKAKDFICVLTDTPIQRTYIQSEGKEDRLSKQLMAIVAEGKNGRVYLTPSQEHENIALAADEYAEVHTARETFLSGSTPTRAMVTGGVCSAYGLSTWGHLFTSRQIVALTTFSNLVTEVQEQITRDGGTQEYAQAIAVYLAFVVDKAADIQSSICTWINTLGAIRNTFARQAIPMTWDFAEANPFSNSSGCWGNMLTWVVKCLERLPATTIGNVRQNDAQSDCGLREIMVSTDPPYYDNISYADVSDFFYVWMRHMLKDMYPDLYRTMFTPKAEELVATLYRFQGSLTKAKEFFEDGMLKAFSQINKYTSANIPITVYYAFKQSDTDSNDATVSTGWETMLSAIIKSGFSITGTWPMRTEREVRTIASGTNALASSIVLVCRNRSSDAPSISRRSFVNELRESLKKDLHFLQKSNISPVDMSQASIGPGMAVFSKYSEVLEADGNPMSIRDALVLINQELDAYLSEQEGRMDTESRFCIAWYEQFGLSAGKYGDADTMARARLANLQELVDDGVLESGRSIVRLKRRDELPEKWDSSREDTIWTIVQQLCRSLETQGIDNTASYMLSLSAMDTSKIENAKNLAYRAFLAADRKGWTDEALAYNSLVTAWPDLIERMNKLKDIPQEQMQLEI